MMKKFLTLFFLLFLFSFLSGAEKEIFAYRKNCAVTPDGALLEDVWNTIPAGNFFRTAERRSPFLTSTVKAVYERDYLCFALKMDMQNIQMQKALNNENVDSVAVTLTVSGKEYHFQVTPLWVKSNWEQTKIHACGVKRSRKYYAAEVRIPIPGEEQFYCQGQSFPLKIVRTSLLANGKKEISFFNGKLLTGDLAYTDNTPRSNKKIWRNGELNTFFKRPNPRWNSNWDLGKGDYLQQGWNLNQAKGMGRFEVFAHEDKEDDYYVVLRNGDFYQMYKGLEKKLSYTFLAKGKGVLKVRFLRFVFKNHALRFKGVHSERVITLDSDEWKEYTGKVEKKNDGESLALDFSTENGEIMLDEAYVRGIK